MKYPDDIYEAQAVERSAGKADIFNTKNSLPDIKLPMSCGRLNLDVLLLKSISTWLMALKWLLYMNSLCIT